MTVEKLAKLSGVSIATVTRFVIFLGYSGYPEFLKDTQQSMQQQVNNSERIKLGVEKNFSKDKSIYEIFEEDVNNIKTTVESLNVFEIKNVLIFSLMQREYI